MLTCTVEEIMARIDALPRDMELSKALMSVLQGISPIIAREVENSAGLGHEVYVKSMTPPAAPPYGDVRDDADGDGEKRFRHAAYCHRPAE